MHQVFRVLCWSFGALAAGVWPSHDEGGRAFGPTYHPGRAARAGQLLAAGARGAWAELRGDWLFLRSVLHLQRHYGRPEVCHLCDAHKTDPERLYTSFRRDAATRASLVSHAAWVAAAVGAALVSPLLLLPGFSIRRVFFDCMHCLDLGILQHAVPSALRQLVAARVFPGATTDARLAEATRDYRVWCRATGVTSVAKRLTAAWIAGPFPSVGQLHAKGAAMRHMVQWMREVCLRAPALNAPHGALRAGLFDALARADGIMRAEPRHMSLAATARLASLFEEALCAYNALAAAAVADGEALYRVIPKLHACTHVAYDNAGVNPRAVHCYPDEDMVGKSKRIYQACHGRTAPHTALLRYALLACMRWQSTLAELRGV